MTNLSIALRWASLCGGMVFGIACGGTSTSAESHVHTDHADAGADATIVGSRDAAAPDRSCVTDDDCTAVLDYRDGFSCWSPEAVSKQAVRGDACLIPWTANPRCTTPAPPADCPGGEIPVKHSCFQLGCVVPRCREGACNLDTPIDCPTPDADPPDCAALLSSHRTVLALARRCDPTKSGNCTGSYADGCGCEVPYDIAGQYANAAWCAFDAWRSSDCSFVAGACGPTTCVTPTHAGATCVPNASGTEGTCQWKQ
jgi:hypothetical protein